VTCEQTFGPIVELRSNGVEYRSFGRSDLKSSVIGFGCGHIASLSTTHPRKEIVATLYEALEKGINFFDTADSYSQGASERLLGRLIRRRRQQALICTKAGYRFKHTRRLALWLKPAAKFLVHWSAAARKAASSVRDRSLGQSFSPDYITTSVEGSLRRLGTEYIDLFLLHSPPSSVIAEGAAFHALDLLKRRGLIRYYGVSCATQADALVCLEHSDISALQLACNLFDSSSLKQLLARAASQNVAVIAREPFAQGRVLRDPRLQHFVDQHPHRTLAQTALQAVMQLPGVDVVLTGMTARSHLVENVGAISAPPLSQDEVDVLSDLAFTPEGITR